MRFKTAYQDGLPRFQFETRGPSLTRQSSKDECDINRIMRKFEKTGILEHRNTFEGSYGDFTDTPQDYHEAIQQVMDAQDMFMSLPAKVRRQFGNDPAEYLDFVADPQNADRMVELGLATRPPAAPDVVEPPKPKKASEEAKKPVSDDPS